MKVTGLRSMLYNRFHREEIYSQREYWDGKASEFSHHAVSMWPNNNLNSLYHIEHLALLDRFLPDVSGKSVLDLGCGTGRISRRLAARGARVLGVDFSPKAVEVARSQSDGWNPAYRVQSMFTLDDVGVYDVCVSWSSICVACRRREELCSVLSLLHRAIRPDGALVLVEPVHKGFLHRVLNLDQRAFIEAVHGAGFDVKEVVHLHFWPARLLLAYLPWPKFITTPVYQIGQWSMRVVFRNRAFGDYLGIYAIRAAEPQ